VPAFVTSTWTLVRLPLIEGEKGWANLLFPSPLEPLVVRGGPQFAAAVSCAAAGAARSASDAPSATSPETTRRLHLNISFPPSLRVPAEQYCAIRRRARPDSKGRALCPGPLRLGGITSGSRSPALPLLPLPSGAPFRPSHFTPRRFGRESRAIAVTY
jgi:hypothetical protein